MQSVNRGQNVEERTIGICRQIEPLGTQLGPSHILSDDKKHAEKKRTIEPARLACILILNPTLDEGNPPARYFERKTAGEKNRRVQVEDAGKGKMPPIQSRLPHDESAGKCRESHRDRCQHHPDSSRSR